MLIKDVERLNGIAQHLVDIFCKPRISNMVEAKLMPQPSTATCRAGRSAKSPVPRPLTSNSPVSALSACCQNANHTTATVSDKVVIRTLV